MHAYKLHYEKYNVHIDITWHEHISSIVLMQLL